MSERLRLVVSNNQEAVKQEEFDTALREGRLRIRCRKCKRWHNTTIGEQMDSPGCPRCGR